MLPRGITRCSISISGRVLLFLHADRIWATQSCDRFRDISSCIRLGLHDVECFRSWCSVLPQMVLEPGCSDETSQGKTLNSTWVDLRVGLSPKGDASLTVMLGGTGNPTSPPAWGNGAPHLSTLKSVVRVPTQPQPDTSLSRGATRFVTAATKTGGDRRGATRFVTAATMALCGFGIVVNSRFQSRNVLGPVAALESL